MIRTLPLIISNRSSADTHETAIHQIEQHCGPAIVTSFGTDLYYRTHQARATRGQVKRFDPFELTGESSDSWSPLSAAANWDGALNVAWHLAAAGQRQQSGGVDGDEHWNVVAEQRIAPLLFAAARSGQAMDQVVAWAYGLNAQTLQATIDALVQTAASHGERSQLDAARAALDAFSAQPARVHSTVEATVQSLLRAYRFNRIIASAASTDITADWLTSGRNTVYLIGDAKTAKLLRPIMVALLESLVTPSGESPLPVLLAEMQNENVGTLIDAHAAAHMARAGRLQRLTVPSHAELSTPMVQPRAKRKLHFRSPITLS